MTKISVTLANQNQNRNKQQQQKQQQQQNLAFLLDKLLLASYLLHTKIKSIAYECEKEIHAAMVSSTGDISDWHLL